MSDAGMVGVFGLSIICGCQAVGIKADRDLRRRAEIAGQAEQTVGAGGRATNLTLNWIGQDAIGPAAIAVAVLSTALMIRNRRALDRVIRAVEDDRTGEVKRSVREAGARHDNLERLIRSRIRSLTGGSGGTRAGASYR